MDGDYPISDALLSHRGSGSSTTLHSLVQRIGAMSIRLQEWRLGDKTVASCGMEVSRRIGPNRGRRFMAEKAKWDVGRDAKCRGQECRVQNAKLYSLERERLRMGVSTGWQVVYPIMQKAKSRVGK